MPMDDASIAQATSPSFAKLRKVFCNKTGSGVVKPVTVKSAGGRPAPSVPINPVGLATDVSEWLGNADRACASHQLVEVLPLVPVTASTFTARDGFPKNSAAIGPVAIFKPAKLAMRASLKSKLSAPSYSTRQALAPASSAGFTKALGSAAAPGQAMNTSPGCTTRLSVTSVPVLATRSRNHCAAWTTLCSGSIRSSPARHWPRCSGAPPYRAAHSTCAASAARCR